MVIAMACALSISALAAPYTYDFGEVETIDYFEKYAENNNGTDYIKTVMYDPQPTSKDARIVFSCTCEKGRHTYPTYYVMSINSSLKTLFQKSYTDLNAHNPCGATYDKNSILAVEVPEGCTDFWGSGETGTLSQHTNLVYVKIPLSLDDLHMNAFRGDTKLEWVEFGNNNKITSINNSAFNGCSALKGICLPDSITHMYNATFIGCVNLGPVHLPNNLVSFGTDPQWSTFQSGQYGNGTKYTKMFLVNERFDNPDEVVKSKVYYMPSKFESCGDQLFRGCSNINDVIVFPTTYKNTGDYRSFIGYGATAENPKTIVFLGDMSTFNGYASSSSSYMNYVFAHPNDTVDGFAPTFTFEGSHNDIIMYSCASGKAGRAYQTTWSSDLFKHFADVRKSVEIAPGNCTEKSTVQEYCFCGAEMGEAEGKVDPTVHEFDLSKNATIVGVSYESYADYGKSRVKCARCTETSDGDDVAPIFTAKGYSTNPEKNAINGGYTVNPSSLALYKRLNGEIKYGVVIANANSFDGKSFFDEDNKVNTAKAVQAEIDHQYSNFDCSINFGANAGVELDLIICAYVIDENGNAAFIQKDTGDTVAIGGKAFKSVNLASVVALVPETTKETF